MPHDLLLDDAAGLLRTLIVGPLAYAFLVAALRVSGKRTLAKLNAFDLVVTVALGSTLASVLTSENAAFAEAAVAFLTLIGLQWIVATASVRWRGFARAVRSDPTLLMRSGEICEDALRRERITRAELMTVIRTSDTNDPRNVAAVILESDGSFSVIPEPEGPGSADYPLPGAGARGT